MLNKETRTSMLRHNAGGDGWRRYLLLWAAAPMVFFTVASNVLWTYVLPGVPAFALLTAELVIAGSRSPEFPLTALSMMRRGAFVMSLVFSIGMGASAMGYGPATRSQIQIIAAYRNLCGDRDGSLVYLFKRPYSADFYSGGKARLANNPNEVEKSIENQERVYIAVRIKDMRHLPASFTRRRSIVFRTRRYCLLA